MENEKQSVERYNELSLLKIYAFIPKKSDTKKSPMQNQYLEALNKLSITTAKTKIMAKQINDTFNFFSFFIKKQFSIIIVTKLLFRHFKYNLSYNFNYLTISLLFAIVEGVLFFASFLSFKNITVIQTIPTTNNIALTRTLTFILPI